MRLARQHRAYLAAAAAIAGWATVATAFKIALRHLDPAGLLTWATWSSTAVLAALLAVTGRLPELRTWRARDLVLPAFLGLLNPLLYYRVLLEAYDRLPAQLALTLNYAWPIVLALLAAPLLGQRVTPRMVVAMGTSLAGVALVAGRGDALVPGGADAVGIALALASTLLWALYWLLNLRAAGRDPLLVLAASFLCASVALLPLAPFLGVGWPGWAGLAGAAYVGTFEMGLTFALWLTALRLADGVARIGSLVFAAPFLSLLLIHHHLGEAVAPASVAGLGLIVAGIVLLGPAGKRV